MTQAPSGFTAPSPAPSIGIDVGGTKIASGVLTGGELHSRHVQPTPETGWPAVLDAIAAQVRDLQARYPDAARVGVGVPGPLSLDRTRVKFAPNIYGFTDVPLVEGLEERLGRRVVLENDAKAAALAELGVEVHFCGDVKGLDTAVVQSRATELATAFPA